MTMEVKKPDAQEAEEQMPKVPDAKRTSVPNEEARDPSIAGSGTGSNQTEVKQPDAKESKEQRPFVPEAKDE